jgi:hypothetical protein
MAIKLPRIGQYSITVNDGRPTTGFQRWINGAFDQIEESITNLGVLLGLVATAQATADDALEGVQNAATESIITPNEKIVTVIPQHAVLTGEQADLDAKATTYGITTEKTNYDNAITALTTFLGTQNTPVAWNNTSGNTNVTRATWNTHWNDVKLTKQLLQNAIDEKTGTVATWAGVSSTPVELTDGRIPTALNTDGRLRTSTNLFSALAVGARNSNTVALSATNSSGVCAINVAAHTRKVPGESAVITVNYNSGSISGLTASTAYYVYCDDPNLVGGAVTYIASTDPDTLVGFAGRVVVGSISTPATSGGGSTGGGGFTGTGGSGGGTFID